MQSPGWCRQIAITDCYLCLREAHLKITRVALHLIGSNRNYIKWQHSSVYCPKRQVVCPEASLNAVKLLKMWAWRLAHIQLFQSPLLKIHKLLLVNLLILEKRQSWTSFAAAMYDLLNWDGISQFWGKKGRGIFCPMGVDNLLFFPAHFFFFQACQAQSWQQILALLQSHAPSCNNKGKHSS